MVDEVYTNYLRLPSTLSMQSYNYALGLNYRILYKSDLTPWVCYIRAYISTQQTTYPKVRSEITSRVAGLGLVALSLSTCYQCGLSPGKKSVRKLTPVPQFDFSIFKFLFTKQIASTMPAFSQLQFTLFLFLLINSPCRLNADALN